jgi:hypothetical protein
VDPFRDCHASRIVKSSSTWTQSRVYHAHTTRMLVIFIFFPFMAAGNVPSRSDKSGGKLVCADVREM